MQASTVADRFGQLLRQPESGGIVPGAPRYAGTADGQRALANAVAALRKRYVEFVHTARHDLLQVTGPPAPCAHVPLLTRIAHRQTLQEQVE